MGRQPGGPQPPGSVDVRRVARVAGLRNFETPTLEQVERRRVELFLLVSAVLLVIAAGFVFVSSAALEIEGLPGFLAERPLVLQVSVLLLALAVGFYVMEKERYLRRLSVALVNERVLSAALENRLRELSSLTEAGKAVLSSLDLDEVLAVIINAASELLGAGQGSILLVDGDGLVVAAATGHAEAYVGTRSGFGEGVAGHVASTREPLLVVGSPTLEEHGVEPPSRGPAIDAALCVPLEAKGELLGVLNLSVSGDGRRFDEYDLRALTLFGEHAAMAIRHARILRRERELRHRMAELDRLRAELVGSMTHDLKTPLTTIMGSARLLLSRSQDLDDDQRTRSLEAIERQSRRLLELIERLLDAARTGASFALSRGIVDLVDPLEALTRAFANAHDRAISFERGADRVAAYADADAVEQVVANLLENAVKYTPVDGPIRVWVRPAPDGAEIGVADAGPGIRPEVREHLFEPYRRGEHETDRTGVGLGLFIVSNLVAAMGGTLSVDCPDSGGTTFVVRLPASAPVAQPAGVGDGQVS